MTVPAGMPLHAIIARVSAQQHTVILNSLKGPQSEGGAVHWRHNRPPSPQTIWTPSAEYMSGQRPVFYT